MSRSEILPAMLLGLLLMLQASQARAWNPDYAYGLPLQRRMCVQRNSPESLRFFSIFEEEECPAGSQRYVVVFGREPRGSMALLPITTARKFYPPLVISWPQREGFNGNPLWHFTCVNNHDMTVLETKLTLYSYKGEITSNGTKDCVEAEKRALKFCQEEWQGNELLEKCDMSWETP